MEQPIVTDPVERLADVQKNGRTELLFFERLIYDQYNSMCLLCGRMLLLETKLVVGNQFPAFSSPLQPL